MTEANAGEGLHFPEKAKFYISWILPLIVILFSIWIMGETIRIKIIMGNSCICCFFDVVKVRYFFVKTNLIIK